MKNKLSIALGLVLVVLLGSALAQTAFYERATKYVEALADITTPDPGDRAVVIDNSAPVMSHWDHVNNTWREGATRDEIQDVSGSFVKTGRTVFRDNFCGVDVIQNDDTARTGTDTQINLIRTDVNQNGYYQFVEATHTLAQVLEVVGGCGLDVSGDVTADDGLEIKFARSALQGLTQVLTSMADPFYFEISVTITDISTVDGDFAFGLMMPEAQQDPPQHDGLDTYLIVTLSDDAGDIDVEADNAGNGAVQDNYSTAWADGATHVFRFEVDDARSAVYIDGAAITLTNCNLAASWFDTADPILPFFYYTQGAQGAASGIIINYVEWGSGTLG